jgi:actin-like ATPase involved in cell morphogenesis
MIRARPQQSRRRGRLGVIADFEITEQMLRFAHPQGARSTPRSLWLIVCAPSGVTGSRSGR